MKTQNDQATTDNGYTMSYARIRASEEKLNAALRENAGAIVEPPINITEAAGIYRIDVYIPGFTRDQIYIQTNGDKLLIEAGNKREPLQRNEYCRILEYDCEYIKREIMVPANVDTAFLSAEYRNGILSLCMYQTHSKVRNDVADIAVY